MDKFETLNDETTILMLNQDTFTVARLKELIQNQLYQRLSQSYALGYSSKEGWIIISNFFNPDLAFFDQKLKISINDFKLRFPPEGLECKLLNLETKEWDIGKLIIIADVKTPLGKSINIEVNKITLEFSSEQPTFEYKSPLDEMRKSFS